MKIEIGNEDNGKRIERGREREESKEKLSMDNWMSWKKQGKQMEEKKMNEIKKNWFIIYYH